MFCPLSQESVTYKSHQMAVVTEIDINRHCQDADSGNPRGPAATHLG